MRQISLEIYKNASETWASAAILRFHSAGNFELEYDLDYAVSINETIARYR